MGNAFAATRLDDVLYCPPCGRPKNLFTLRPFHAQNFFTQCHSTAVISFIHNIWPQPPHRHQEGAPGEARPLVALNVKLKACTRRQVYSSSPRSPTRHVYRGRVPIARSSSGSFAFTQLTMQPLYPPQSIRAVEPQAVDRAIITASLELFNPVAASHPFETLWSSRHPALNSRILAQAYP